MKQQVVYQYRDRDCSARIDQLFHAILFVIAVRALGHLFRCNCEVVESTYKDILALLCAITRS